MQKPGSGIEVRIIKVQIIKVQLYADSWKVEFWDDLSEF